MNKNFIFHNNGKILETKITVQLSNGEYTTYSVFYDLINNIKLDSNFTPVDAQQPFFRPDNTCCISLPDPEDLPQYCEILVSATENLGWLYGAVLHNFAFYTTISSFIINGVEQLGSPIGIQITPDNADVIVVGVSFGINNITNALNALSPDFVFEVVGVNGNGAWFMSVTYPYDYEWSITLTGTRPDPTPAPYVYDNIDGMLLTNEGAQCVYYFGTTGCGPIYETGSPARYLNPLNKTCY